ncbi:isopropylmalate/isohomocitrate dehydrogenase [Methanocaldococcus vulcanius M7]|uniref:Isopropylmalate/isohomocitrate dehydrogenase n=1 Tax=Methanocaldococcus vulcanius (strain ATCC 700851 / DSM 12094 / M7) TaxID=579137 RepID=C9RGA8_METVM|nr:homoisocitrate dehydrogenase [Methanocaldococcus vulcanius]ACX72610.1 isopropylmalate/isohomocitrate dehydrogenase [Methanocaldococcus vulcanius M7]
MRKVCVMEGDGIGKEVIPEALKVLKELGDFEIIKGDVGLECLKKYGTALPDETIEKAKEADVILFGAITSPKPNEVKNYKSPIITLRRMFDLYANVRPINNFGVGELIGRLNNYEFLKVKDVDLVIIRENTEGLYVGREKILEDDIAISERIITRKGSERIIRFAFEYAKRNNRKKVSCIHKANVLRVSDGLFLKIFNEIKEKYNNIKADDFLVDSTAMNLIKYPEKFDVIVTTNLFGDILSDEASVLIGGLGLAPSANIGGKKALFEPVHGSAPDIAGKGIANPMASILSVAMLFDYMGEKEKGDIIREAVKQCIINKKTTPDLGGNLKTVEVGDEIVRYIRKRI